MKKVKFKVVEELNKKLFEREVNLYISDGRYKLVNASATGTSLTKYTAFLVTEIDA